MDTRAAVGHPGRRSCGAGSVPALPRDRNSGRGTRCGQPPCARPKHRSSSRRASRAAPTTRSAVAQPPQQRRPDRLPGPAGQSHNHTFIGNRAVDADTTPTSLLGGTTSLRVRTSTRPRTGCRRSSPDARTSRPAGVVYYVNRSRSGYPLRRRESSCSRATPSPPAASPRASSRGVAARWAGGLVTPRSRPAGPTPMLQLQATFPNCWDGQRLDSPGSPPAREVRVAWPVPGVASGRASDDRPHRALPARAARLAGRVGQARAHADFMNGWDQAELERLIRERSLRR